MEERPVRAPGIDVSEAADGYVVFDPEHDRVHYLNHTAALVLEFCTGDNTRDDIVRMLQVAYDLADPPHDAAEECLALLREEGLVR